MVPSGGEDVNGRVEAVQRMQDYIEAHLSEDLTMAELSGAALYSPWHAYRLFVSMLGMTPAAYIRRLRLSRAALRLREGGARVLDVALDSGFESADGFQRAFHSAFGCNPCEYATRPVPIALFRPYGVKYAPKGGTKDMKDVSTVFVRAVEKPARKVVLKRGREAKHYMQYCEEVGCDVWGILSSMDCLGGEPVCLWLPEKFIAPGTSEYVQGAEEPTDYAGPVPEGFDVIDLPACTYLEFRGEPFAEEDWEDAIRDLWAAREKYDPALAGYRWEEENPRIQLEPQGERGYIELYPVKPL